MQRNHEDETLCILITLSGRGVRLDISPQFYIWQINEECGALLASQPYIGLDLGHNMTNVFIYVYKSSPQRRVFHLKHRSQLTLVPARHFCVFVEGLPMASRMSALFISLRLFCTYTFAFKDDVHLHSNLYL